MVKIKTVVVLILTLFLNIYYNYEKKNLLIKRGNYYESFYSWSILKEDQNLEDLMAPYQENTMSDCNPLYLQFTDETESMREDYEKSYTDRFDTFEQFAKEYYGAVMHMGNYGYWSNPNAQWDWYTIGGRWENSISLKDGNKTNSAKVKDIDFSDKDNLATYAVITSDGKWHSKGEMMWFGCSSETKEEAEKWDSSFYDTFIKDADPELTFVIVDCHI